MKKFLVFLSILAVMFVPFLNVSKIGAQSNENVVYATVFIKETDYIFTTSDINFYAKEVIFRIGDKVFSNFSELFEYSLLNNVSVGVILNDVYLHFSDDYERFYENGRIGYPINNYTYNDYATYILIDGSYNYIKVFNGETLMFQGDHLFFEQDVLVTINFVWDSPQEIMFELERAYNDGFLFAKEYYYNDGYNKGWTDGYDYGLVANVDNSYWGVLFSALMAPFSLLSIEIFKGVTIGMIVLIPIVLGLIAFLFKLGGRGK